MESEKLVSASTIAKEFLGISKRSFWRLRAQGKIGPKEIKVGGPLRWKWSEIMQWLDWNCCSRQEFIGRKELENAK